MDKKKVIWIINQTAGKLDSGWGERHFYLSLHWVKKGYNVKIIDPAYGLNQPVKIEDYFLEITSFRKIGRKFIGVSEILFTANIRLPSYF